MDAPIYPAPSGERAEPPARGFAGTPGPPVPDWPPWMAPAALVGGIVLAALGALLVDIPALLFGVNINASHLPGGLAIADTVVQDLAFVAIAVFLAQMGGRVVSSAMFGLRPADFWPAVGLALVTLIGFLLFSVVWTEIVHTGKDKVLEQLGTDESATLLILSAALTCAIAPICEEFLFRGFIFTALRNLRGLWPAAIITGLLFGGVHASSAPALDLVPLAALGVGLCLLYRATGSLYPGIAVHSLNNSLAFGLLEKWNWWQVSVLMVAALALIGSLALLLIRIGVISRERPFAARTAFTVTGDG
jgi:membrane protease YdiL (CAAX protease family)